MNGLPLTLVHVAYISLHLEIPILKNYLHFPSPKKKIWLHHVKWDLEKTESILNLIRKKIYIFVSGYSTTVRMDPHRKKIYFRFRLQYYCGVNSTTVLTTVLPHQKK